MDSSTSYNDIPLRVQPSKLSTGSVDRLSTSIDAYSLSEQASSPANNVLADAPLERRLGLWSGMAIVMGSIIGS
ncbi:hypothetical protein H4R99_005742, partial [Coemansia sp. RSA 1722]